MNTPTVILKQVNMKPYWKLGQLIAYAAFNNLITKDEAACFDEELNLLVKGINRSHLTEPRAYMTTLNQAIEHDISTTLINKKCVEKEYNIYHPFGGSLNHDCKPLMFEYEHIGTVMANSLNQAFTRSQNDFNEEYAKLGKRSTCVGDIIADDNGIYMVKGLGFAKITNEWLTYIDWGNHMRMVEEMQPGALASEMYENQINELYEDKTTHVDIDLITDKLH